MDGPNGADAPPNKPWRLTHPVLGTTPAGDRTEERQGPSRASGCRDSAGVAFPSVMREHDAIRAVGSHHLRAARALLGWAMSDLARVSGLSLSTVRRLEQNVQAVGARNHRCAVEALRLGGIRFLALDDGTIALAELGHMATLARMTGGDGEPGGFGGPGSDGPDRGSNAGRSTS